MALKSHIVNISGGVIKSWTIVENSGILPGTPNTHSINISGGQIKSWTVTATGSRTPNSHSIDISGGLVKSWDIGALS